MSSRWWQDGSRTIEDEQRAFANAGLTFDLDQEALEAHEVVVFRGQITRAGRSLPATVVYPPGYVDGEHPRVFCPDLGLTRHWRPHDGLLCLDHLLDSEDRPMDGAEAVIRAVELWRLHDEDPDALAEQEVDAPEPATELYSYEPLERVFLIGADISGHSEGWLTLEGTGPRMRAQVVAMGGSLKGGDPLTLDVPGPVVGGNVPALGCWRRVPEPPPWRTPRTTLEWIREQHPDLIKLAMNLGTARGTFDRRARTAVVAIVFPDEGPRRGEQEDRWVAALLDVAKDDARLVRVDAISRDALFTRQPGMVGLAAKRVVLAGAGALGSHVADHLARAGVAHIDIIDPDLFEAGNAVRHVLPVGAAGLPKADSLAAAIRGGNPFITTDTWHLAIGTLRSTGDVEQVQVAHDEWTVQIAGANLVINATAAGSSSRWLARMADRLRVPVVHTAVSSGAWGARIQIQNPGHSGCPECLAMHQLAGGEIVPGWKEDPDGDEIVGGGCAQPTFAGPGFELADAAAATARICVQSLLAGDGYPPLDFDLATLTLRTAESARSKAQYTALPRHPDCGTCSA